MFSLPAAVPIKGRMAKSRQKQEGKQPAGFRPRRAVLPIGEPDEKRVVVRAYMPASLAKDITLYAIERDCSVSDLLNSVLRKAIPSLKVVAAPGKAMPAASTDDATDDPDIHVDEFSRDADSSRSTRSNGAAA